MAFNRTKIRPPRFRVGLIERLELEDRLGSALSSRRLVLLAAPAGYGKTAALSRQLSLLPSACAKAWVTVDEQDDLPRFLSCLTNALEPYDPPWRTDPELLPDEVTSERGLRAVVDELVNALDTVPVERGVMALDDIHCVADARLFRFLDLLVERLPLNWTVAIAARATPPLALSRLRAQREVAEFGQADLSFGEHEVRRLCAASGRADGDEAVQRLFRRTMGWPAALCLSLNTGPAPTDRMSQRHLFDYLASEVFEQLPVEMREFLMRCSVLPELTAGRCAAVSGNPRAADLLDQVERGGLFVSVLDAEEFTLRLHDLVRDFLDDQLRRRHGDELALLLRRAAEGESDPVRKVDLLLRAGAWAEAQEVLALVTSLLVSRGDGEQVMRLVERFPAELRASSPQLALSRGRCAIVRYDFEQMFSEMQRAAAGFERQGDALKAQRARSYLACVMLARGMRADGLSLMASVNGAPADTEIDLAKAWGGLWDGTVHGPAAAAGRHFARLVEVLSHTDQPALWYLFMPAGGMVFVRPDCCVPAERWVRGALAVAGDRSLLRVEALCVGGMVHLYRGQLDKAADVMDELRSDEAWISLPRPARFRVMMFRTLYAAMRGDGETIDGAAADDTPPFLVPGTCALKGLHGSATGNWRKVAQVLAEWDNEPQMAVSYWVPFQALLQGRLALHERRHDDALAVLREAVEGVGEIDRMGLDAMVRVSLAVAEHRAGSHAAAWHAAAPLVDQVRGSQDSGGVLLCGRDLLVELAGAPWGPEVPRQAVAEMQRWAGLSRHWQLSNPRASAGPAAPRATQPLSARELEVLACIAAGDSNKLIARKLDLSPHTVKRHVARILARLGLSSRGAAAAWYHRRDDAQASGSL